MLLSKGGFSVLFISGGFMNNRMTRIQKIQYSTYVLCLNLIFLTLIGSLLEGFIVFLTKHGHAYTLSICLFMETVLLAVFLSFWHGTKVKEKLFFILSLYPLCLIGLFSSIFIWIYSDLLGFVGCAGVTIVFSLLSGYFLVRCIRVTEKLAIPFIDRL